MENTKRLDSLNVKGTIKMGASQSKSVKTSRINSDHATHTKLKSQNIEANKSTADIRVFKPQGSAPSNPNYGTVYFDSGTDKLKVYVAGEWKTVKFE